jgi:tRNA 2-thiouridine synthesizing protein C
MTTKSLLFLLRQAGNTVHAQEALDSVLVAGVFDQSVSLLFKDEGVWQLATRESGGKHTSDKTIETVLSLADYEVRALYVCEHSLSSRNLSQEDLLVPVEVLNIEQQTQLISRQDAVIND